MADEINNIIPVLETGELAFDHISKELYVGTNDGNEKISSKSEIEDIHTELDNKSNNGHTHSKSEITNMPTMLRNPYPLDIEFDGTFNTTYDEK